MNSKHLIVSALFAVILSYTLVEGDHVIRVSVSKGRRKETRTESSRLNRRFRKEKASFIPERLKNVDNFLYYGTISMGTPPQNLVVDFDTGSGDIWLPSTSCKSQSCVEHKKFDSTASSTFKNDTRRFSISYGDGSRASGYTAYDTLRINGVDIANQGFALVNKEDGFEFDPEDGMFGLAYRNCSEAGFPTAIDNAYSQGLIDRKVFAFWLNRNTVDKDGGELIIGKIDPNHYIGKFFFLLIKSFS